MHIRHLTFVRLAYTTVSASRVDLHPRDLNPRPELYEGSGPLSSGKLQRYLPQSLMIVDKWRESGRIPRNLGGIVRNCLDVRADLGPYGPTP